MTGRKLDFGLMLPTHAPRGQPFDPSLVGSTASWAEGAGFASVWVGDHIVHPWQFLESLTCLAFAAALTERVRIGTSVLLAPMRQVSVMAAQLATLATLSGGRLALGLGVGGEWPREWQAAGVPTKERGARMDEAIALMRRLFAGETVNCEGRFTSLDGVSISPAPPPIPMLMAGRAPVALERVGRESDGWLAFFVTPNGFERDSAAIDEVRAREGRNMLPFERGILLNFQIGDDDELAMDRALELNLGFASELALAGNAEQLKRFALAGRPETVIARLQEYVTAGCTTFVVSPMDKDNEAYQSQARRFAREILPALIGG